MMAKKPQGRTPGDLRDLDSYLASSFGQAFVVDQPEVSFLPTGLASVDRALGGGIARGRLVELYGDPSSGKTSLSLHIARRAVAEKLYVLYFDLESCLTLEYLKAFDLDFHYFKLLQPIQAPISAEDLFTRVREMASLWGEELGLVVVDSVPFLIPESEAEAHAEGRAPTYSPLASFLSRELKYVVPALARSNTILLFINQETEVLGARFPLRNTPGGRRLKYACSQRIHISRVSRPEYDTSTRMTVEIRVEKNKVGDPFRRAQFDIVFGRGPDEASSLLQEALSLGLLQQRGAWITFEESLLPELQQLGWTKPQLAQGAERASQELSQNSQLFQWLYRKVVGQSALSS